MSRWLRARATGDRLLGALLLVLAGPVIAALGLIVRVRDGGPAFITVPRIGRNGRTFGMWKIRSMRASGSDGRADGLGLSGTGDDRITPVGRWLRSYYLDELPQLLNVVAGQMTLLGPRPEAPEFVDLDDPRWQAVLAVAPGMAGPTQLLVSAWETELIGRSADGRDYVETVLPVKLAVDRWYVTSSNPRTDALVVRSLARRLLGRSSLSALTTLVRDQVPEVTAIPDPASPAGTRLV